MEKINSDSIDRVIKRDDIRGKYPNDLNEDLAYLIGQVIVKYILTNQNSGKNEKLKLIVGRDVRLSSVSLNRALTLGLVKAGAEVYDLGQCGTELLTFAVGNDASMNGGVMITASHNPKDENGFKIVKQGAEPISANELKKISIEIKKVFQEGYSPFPRYTLTQEYVERVLKVSDIRRESPKRLRVIVEAGNGIGGVMFQEVAHYLSFLDIIYSNLTPDGSFPVQLPNPLKASYMKLLQTRVIEEKADIGIAFDGDADRIGVVDPESAVVSSSEIIGIITERLLQPEKDNRKIMYNLVCSRSVPDIIKSLNGIPVMTPVGYGQIRERMRKSEHKDCVFAGEHSGHYFFSEFFRADSGMIAALMMIEAALVAKNADSNLHEKLSHRRARYFLSNEVNFNFNPQSKCPEGQVRATMQAAVREVYDNYGHLTAIQSIYPNVRTATRVTGYSSGDLIRPSNKVDILKMEFTEDFGDWWFCVRPSGNEPLLRLIVEIILNEDFVGEIDGHKILEERLNNLTKLIGQQYLEC